MILHDCVIIIQLEQNILVPFFFLLTVAQMVCLLTQNQTVVFMTLSSLPDYFRLLWSLFSYPVLWMLSMSFTFLPTDELPCSEHCDLLTVQASKQCSAFFLRFTGWMSESCCVLLLLNDSASLCCRVRGRCPVNVGEQRALSRVPSDRWVYVVRAWWNRWRMLFSYTTPKFYLCFFFIVTLLFFSWNIN